MASLDLYFLDKRIPKEIASNFFLVMKSDNFFALSPAQTQPLPGDLLLFSASTWNN